MDLLNTEATPKVVFYRGNEVVAEAAAKAVDGPKKANQTQILYTMKDNASIITEMRVAGWKEKRIIEEPQETPRTGQ